VPRLVRDLTRTRVHLIPFNRQFDPGTEPDLPDKLRAEAAGILAWAVRDCLEWQKTGLNPPSSVVEATKAYREESDPLRDFVADRCILHPDVRITVAELWAEYLKWCLQTGVPHAVERHVFSRRLEALGCRKTRFGHKRDWTWQGIWPRVDVEAQHLPTADVRAEADLNLQ
jgi:phage/plasmid-associated DNA primase